MPAPMLHASWPVPINPPLLTGRLVQLERLQDEHLRELAAAGSDPSMWEFTTSSAETLPAMRAYLTGLLGDWERGTAIPFLVRRREDHLVVGCTRLKELDRRHRHAMIGSWYAPSVWRTGVNLEAKLLLLDYAFQDLGCIRIEFHTDSRNARSRKSLKKLGATFEGVLRAHQITRKGELRHSAIYSILEEEWQVLRERIAERLRARHSHPGGK